MAPLTTPAPRRINTVSPPLPNSSSHINVAQDTLHRLKTHLQRWAGKVADSSSHASKWCREAIIIEVVHLECKEKSPHK